MISRQVTFPFRARFLYVYALHMHFNDFVTAPHRLIARKTIDRSYKGDKGTWKQIPTQLSGWARLGTCLTIENSVFWATTIVESRVGLDHMLPNKKAGRKAGSTRLCEIFSFPRARFNTCQSIAYITTLSMYVHINTIYVNYRKHCVLNETRWQRNFTVACTY